MARFLAQPLITRPPYGAGRLVAQSGLPDGGHSPKGLPLDDSIPGTSTHNKDEKDVRDFDKPKDEPIYRTDNADDQLTHSERVPVREDNANKHDGIGAWGKGKWEGPKTKYPYRDDIPNTVNASAEYVLAAWEADQAPVRRIQARSRVKVAVRLDAIVKGLNPRSKRKARRCATKLRRSDPRNLRWIVAVNCGNRTRVVKIKGWRGKQITKLSKMDLDLSCSCPAWRWQGPEHHSKREDYLDGKPRGTASVPVIRDPRNINRVCKHVYSALMLVKQWNVAKKERK